MSNRNKIKIGLAGASWFADLWYLPAVQRHADAELYAICSESGDSARRMAEKYGIPHVYASYEDMLDHAKLDGVCIVTPNDTHAPIAEAAMKKGIHVICEKPLALHLEEADKLVCLAQETGVIHAVNFTYREHPGVRRMKELMESGLIGRLRSGHFEYTGEYGVEGPPHWRGIVAKGGIGGVLADLGSHLIDLAQYVGGDRLTEVSAEAQFVHRDKHPDAAADEVIFVGRCAQGAQASFRTSWIEHQGDKGQTIHISLNGELGKLDFAASHLGAVLTRTLHKQSSVPVDMSDEVPAWNEIGEASESSFRPWRLTERNEVWKWIDQICARKEGNAIIPNTTPTFEDAYYVQAVMDAVMTSALNKQRALVQ